jgi:hypothetical protein
MRLLHGGRREVKKQVGSNLDWDKEIRQVSDFKRPVAAVLLAREAARTRNTCSDGRSNNSDLHLFTFIRL